MIRSAPLIDAILCAMIIFVMSGHSASIKGADRIMVLDNGGISAIGTHAELLAVSKIYQDIYKSQLKEGEQFS